MLMQLCQDEKCLIRKECIHTEIHVYSSFCEHCKKCKEVNTVPVVEPEKVNPNIELLKKLKLEMAQTTERLIDVRNQRKNYSELVIALLKRIQELKFEINDLSVNQSGKQ